MHVVAGAPRAVVAATLDPLRLVAAAQDVTDELAPRVEPDGVKCPASRTLSLGAAFGDFLASAFTSREAGSDRLGLFSGLAYNQQCLKPR